MKRCFLALILAFAFGFSGLYATININTASEKELMTLKGIGEAQS